jgi:ferritin-like metal-binding protein YciE
VKRDFGLTAGQYAQVAAIAADWRTKFDAVNAKAKPLLAQGLTSVSSPDLNNLVEEHRQVTRAHIARLQAVFGSPARLSALEALVMKPRPSGLIRPK